MDGLIEKGIPSERIVIGGFSQVAPVAEPLAHGRRGALMSHAHVLRRLAGGGSDAAGGLALPQEARRRHHAQRLDSSRQGPACERLLLSALLLPAAAAAVEPHCFVMPLLFHLCAHAC